MVHWWRPKLIWGHFLLLGPAAPHGATPLLNLFYALDFLARVSLAAGPQDPSLESSHFFVSLISSL